MSSKKCVAWRIFNIRNSALLISSAHNDLEFRRIGNEGDTQRFDTISKIKREIFRKFHVHRTLLLNMCLPSIRVSRLFVSWCFPYTNHSYFSPIIKVPQTISCYIKRCIVILEIVSAGLSSDRICRHSIELESFCISTMRLAT